ncbi:MAG: hypothetical protein NVS4B3_01800 [Gemmatimonadaceae bacterium]
MAVTAMFPVFLLLAIEGALRLVGYGDSYPLFVPYPLRPEYLHPNPNIAAHYFPDGTITPRPQLDFFRAAKQPGTFRIVFQGESSAAGFPYRHGGAPSRMLEQRLQATFPNRSIEVVNTALTAINSYTLLDFADEIIDQHPDAVLIYTGHNEYYGVFGVGSTRSVGGQRSLIKAYLLLSRLRLTQLLQAALTAGAHRIARPDTARQAGTVMEMLAAEQRIVFGSAAYQEGLNQFRANLRDLLARYQRHGIPVLIGTVASNERDQTPFIGGTTTPVDSAAWGRSYRAGLAAMEQGDLRAADRFLLAATRLDSLAADAFYALGKLADASGEVARERSYYRLAKERDQLRFRAPEAMNDIIREEAHRAGARVVETQRALEEAAPNGVIGGTLMLEHVHPNIEGYFLIADAFYQAMRQMQMIGSWEHAVVATVARRDVPITAVDSLAALFRTDRLRSGWPFQPSGRRLTPVVDTLHPRDSVEVLAQELARGTLVWPDAMEQLRRYYERTGDYDQAIRVARAMAQEYRYAAQPYLDAARVAIIQRRYEEALGFARLASGREESASSVQLIGLLLLRLRNQPGALPYLQRSVELAPNDQRMHLVLTAAAALPEFERARARSPHDTAVLLNLAGVYAVTQQFERTKEILSEVRAVDPRNGSARKLLQNLPP